MTKKKFIPMAGLDDLNEEQRQEYYINACDFFGIPAELNLLRFLWLDSGDGGKHLVLYALRGATDIMRGNRGICVDSIRETIGDGFIMFTATGHDKTGRVDVAVGAADTKGRSGKYLADSIMTAQTRATRRLTLQFVGGGLLDESEVQNTTTDISRATKPLAEIAAPASLSPNPGAGRDITPVPTPTIDPAIIAAGDSLVKGMIEGVNVAVAAAIAEEPKKRRRRKKGEVVLESPGQDAPTEMAQAAVAHMNGPTEAQIAAAAVLNKIVETAKTVTVPPPTDVPVLTITEAPLPPKVELKDQPNAEQIKVFKDRLFNYTNTILKQGKMIPCEGIGGIAQKMLFFVKAMFATAETKHLTVNQWESFLGFLDEKYAEIGAEGLVKLINQKIGAKE